MTSSSPPTSPLTPSSPSSIYLHFARNALHRSISPRSCSTSPSHVSDYFEYVPAVPNLELHSAAAEGNVGLVHYALTHGQPVNSVLHGVQPIHAAAAGGSVSALKMLIDRGADVNAPRLPRRYSNEKKRGAPSLGAAGATPLHFAAANGHAGIVQILLTCGAVSNKSDKLGQTPESLAEANGHEDVLHVLRVYEHLKQQDSADTEVASIASGSILASDIGSPAMSSFNLHDEPRPSLKGKERAMSIASNRSDASGLIRLRKSLDGLLGRRSRRNSGTAEMGEEAEVPPVPPLPPSPPRIDVHRPPEHPDEADDEADVIPDSQPKTSSRPSSPDHLPFPPSGASSVYHSPTSGNSPKSIYQDLPDLQTAVPDPEFSASSTSEVVAPAMNIDLARIMSGESEVSADSGRSTVASIRSGLHLAPPRARRSSHSSRRPSLPSILEKAAHPGQAFRNALHRRDQPDQIRFVAEEDSSRSVSGGSFFSRGRSRHNEPVPAGNSGAPNLVGAQDKARRYMSKNSFIGLFRRSNSPPSRSPSPPKRRTEARALDAQVLEEGMERFKRASIELDRKERRSLDEEREREPIRVPPRSAPPIKTRFFEDMSANPPPIPASMFITSRSDGRKSPISPPTADRPWNRPRKGSEVIAPSPLANEWARESSDSDSTAPTGIRRTKTEGAKETRGPSRLSQSSGPGNLRATKQRSATLPTLPPIATSVLGRNASTPRLADLTLSERRDLRSGVLRRESEKKREVGDEDDEEDIFHDALVDINAAHEVEVPAEERLVDEQPEAEEPKVISPTAMSMRGRFRGASIGSMTSQSSRLSTPPGSSIRFSSNPSEDGGSDRFGRLRSVSDLKIMPPPPPPSSMMGDTRPRGVSVSSIATTASGSGLAFSLYNQSTAGTSLTPPSTLSITLGSAFPPVPENDVANHSPSSIPPVPQRKFSSRAEAAKAIKQQEDDVLQLAQLPLDANSTRDLAAQLAAYGESHALEQELAQIERRERNYARRTARGKSKFEIPDDTGSERGSASGSFVSAQSVPSAIGSGLSGLSSGMRSGSISSSLPHTTAPPSLISVEAPKSSVPNINTIYDRRAVLYREKMQALTSLHPPPGSARGGRDSRQRQQRQRAVTDNMPTSPPAWLTGASAAGRTEISSSLPPGSLPVQPPGQGIMAGASVPRAPRSRKGSFNSLSARPIPAPIADIVNTRYQGLAGPGFVSGPPPLSFARPSVNALRSVSSRATHTSLPGPSPSIGVPLAAVTSHPHSVAPTPSVSIFSHRFAGPADGGDSDDSEGQQTGYTMIENDWRGARAMSPGDAAEGLARKGKWGFKGPFGKKK